MADAAPAANSGTASPAVERRVPRLIAVDGSAASGKSTIGRKLAAALGYPFLDTGVMYRAVTAAALQRQIDVNDEESLSRMAQTVDLEVTLIQPGSSEDSAVRIDGRDVTALLRGVDVEEAVSLVSRVPGVREALVKRQREIADGRALVMAGRDIGTVVLPHAAVKIYLDAELEERARRRYAEYAEAGRDVTRNDVMRDIQRRDQIDAAREVSPLRPADDAVRIETSGMTQDEVLRRVLELVGPGP
jgi:cytidylate kinase